MHAALHIGGRVLGIAGLVVGEVYRGWRGERQGGGGAVRRCGGMMFGTEDLKGTATATSARLAEGRGGEREG